MARMTPFCLALLGAIASATCLLAQGIQGGSGVQNCLALMFANSFAEWSNSLACQPSPRRGAALDCWR